MDSRVEQERVRTLLVDTVTLLCKNGLRFAKQLQVQGLLAITIDEADVFVVQLSNIVKSDNSAAERVQSAFSQKSFESGDNSEGSDIERRNIPSHNIQKPRSHRQAASSMTGSQNLTASTSVSCQSKPSGVVSHPGQSRVKQEHPPNDNITLVTSDDEEEAETRHLLSDSISNRIVNDEQYQNIENNTLLHRDTSHNDVKPVLENILLQTSRSYATHTQSGRGRKATRGRQQLQLSTGSSLKLEPVDNSSVLGMSTMDEGCFIEQQNHSTIAAESVRGEGEAKEFGGGEEGNEYEEEDESDMKWNSEVGDYDQEDEYFLDHNLDEGVMDDSESRNSSGGRGSAGGHGVSICEYENCGKWFNHRRSLYRHQRIKHGALFGASGQMCFYCTVPTCRRVFYVRRTLEKHQRDVHNMNV